MAQYGNNGERRERAAGAERKIGRMAGDISNDVAASLGGRLHQAWQRGVGVKKIATLMLRRLAQRPCALASALCRCIRHDRRRDPVQL